MGINALLFRFVGYSWAQALYGGALLAQIGEFSFVLASLGLASGLVTDTGFQLATSVIGLSLALSPLQIELVKFCALRKVVSAAD